MKRNKLVTHKAFDYTGCDDFAHYLEQMAAQGWHFKEWNTGLVFERGEPEDAVFAVEVFIDGSEYDVRPGVHTLNFADYCEAAGWKLLDGKRKFCIFKRICPDAVPILTPEERVKNAAKAAGRRVWTGFALGVWWLAMCLINFTFQTNFNTTVFSDAMLLATAALMLFFLSYSIRLCSFLVWKHRAGKMAQTGQYRVLTSKGQRFDFYATCVISLLYVAAMLVQGEYGRLLWFALLLLVFVGAAWLIARFRTDPETNNLIQVGAVVLLFLAFAVSAAVQLAQRNAALDQQETPKSPLHYQDIGIDPGPISHEYGDERTSVLGTHQSYTVYYGEEYPKKSLSCTIFRTRQLWILDRIWSDRLNAAYNTEREYCTDAWGAAEAYKNAENRYFVRYEDAVLILGFDDVTLTQEQIDTVLDKLGLR